MANDPRIFEQPAVPVDFINDTITDTDGARDLLRQFWQRSDAEKIAFCQVSFPLAASAGVYRTDGPGVTNGVGNFLAAGGGVLYLQSLQEIRNFRAQATGALNTMPFSATLFGWVD
jgi:hypothetical protein